MELGHFLTRSVLTNPEVSSKVYHDSFCQLGSSVSCFITLGNFFENSGEILTTENYFGSIKYVK
jgi:hypothetical protein